MQLVVKTSFDLFVYNLKFICLDFEMHLSTFEMYLCRF